jgi:hypothetical protein
MRRASEIMGCQQETDASKGAAASQCLRTRGGWSRLKLLRTASANAWTLMLCAAFGPLFRNLPTLERRTRPVDAAVRCQVKFGRAGLPAVSRDRCPTSIGSGQQHYTCTSIQYAAGSYVADPTPEPPTGDARERRLMAGLATAMRDRPYHMGCDTGLAWRVTPE